MTKAYDENNVFAKIIRKEIPADIIFEDDKVLAFKDVTPAAPVHFLVVPKKSYYSYADFIENAEAAEVAYYFQKIKDITDELGLGSGFRLITNNGSDASQTVEHFHFHILAGRQLGGLLSDDKLSR